MDPVLAALIGTIVTGIGIGFTVYLAWGRDKVAKETGIATTTGDSIERVMRGFSDLNTALQRENERHSKRIDDLERQVREEAAECKRQVALLDEQLRSIAHDSLRQRPA